MDKAIQEELKQLSPPQRTLFHALRHRFGERLGFSDAVLLYVVRQAFVPPSYAPKKSILRIGDHHDLLTLLAAGTVKVTCVGANDKPVILQMVTDGHAFGLPSLAGESEPRRFGAVAHAPALIALLGPDALRNMIARLDTERRLRLITYGWNANIGLLLEKRLLLSLSVRNRIWYVLSRLARKGPAREQKSGTIALQLTQKDIAQLVGASRSTVCRSLAVLVRDGHIFRGHGHYAVSDAPSFAATPNSPTPIPTGSVSFPDDEEMRREVSKHLRDRAERMGLKAGAIDAFVDHARLVMCAPGEAIALPDGHDALTLLVSGAARVERPGPDGKPLALLFIKPGQFIVGSGASRGSSVAFRAVAHVESCAAILSRDGLARVVAAMSSADMLRFLAFGWRVFSHHHWNVCQFLTMNDKERILHQLRQLAIDFPEPHKAGTIINLPLSRADIGRLVAAGESVVGRCLRKLESEGRIAFEKQTKHIRVLGLFAGKRGPYEEPGGCTRPKRPPRAPAARSGSRAAPRGIARKRQRARRKVEAPRDTASPDRRPLPGRRVSTT